MTKYNKNLTEVIQVRVTPDLKESIDLEAERLGVRPADIVRVYLAILLRGKTIDIGLEDLVETK